MRSAVDMLVLRHPVISHMASSALIFLAFGGLAAVVGEAISIVVKGADAIVVGGLLGLTLVLSLAAMVGATYQVVRKRRELDDWGVFLAITWVLPYVGIAAYLGGINITRRLRSRERHWRAVARLASSSFRKLPRQADTSKVEFPANRCRYSEGVRSPKESWGRSSLYSSIHQ